MQATLWNCHVHAYAAKLYVINPQRTSSVDTSLRYTAFWQLGWQRSRGVMHTCGLRALKLELGRPQSRSLSPLCWAVGFGGELCRVIAVIYDLELGITG